MTAKIIRFDNDRKSEYFHNITKIELFHTSDFYDDYIVITQKNSVKTKIMRYKIISYEIIED